MASSSDRDKDSKDTQSQADNPFIKFRQFADAQIGSLLQGIIGLPSAFSKNSNDNGRWAEFDEELRRRDELQARQKELRESEARRLGTENGGQETPIKKSSGWGDNYTQTSEMSSKTRDMDERTAKDLPLYSPVTKALFTHLRPVDSNPDWNQYHRIITNGDGLRSEYFPFKMKSEQTPSNNLEALQYLAYNEVDSSSTFRSNYSLLPYLLFSPYSPIKLSMESPTGQGEKENRTQFTRDNFPYHTAFKDLIRTTQGSIGSVFPRSILAFPPFNQLSMNIGAHQSIASMAWIHDLYRENLLQEREIRCLPRSSDMVSSLQLSASKFIEEEKDNEEAQTEQDMYDRFLRWASTPSAIAGTLDSLCTDTEGFIEKQLKFLDSPEGLRVLKDFMGTEFAKEFTDMAEKLQKLDRDAQSQHSLEKTVSEKTHKTPQDLEKVVSTSTTTEQTTHEDGSVETCVTVWKRFADGRESVTTTTHHEDRVDDYQNSTTSGISNADEKKGKAEVKKSEKKGWFWN